MNKTAIYTVVTNGYDTVKPVINEPGYDYFLFTDDDKLEVSGWTTIPTKASQRTIKLLPHVYLKDYEASLYMDANITPSTGVSRFISMLTNDMVTFKHPLRDCFIDEHYACIAHRKANEEAILDQLAYNVKLGIKPKSGMFQTGVIYRKHTEEVINFCECWNNELIKFTHRDQLSIMTAVKLTGFTPASINWNMFPKFFKISQHLKKSKPVIHYFTPYNTDGNIGKAMNEHCALVQDPEAWIAVMDGDILFPNPQWGKLVEQAIQNHGKDYSLIGCVTNRVGGEHQCVDGMFGEMDILKHYEKSMEISSSNVIPLGDKGVAGYFMLFQKKTWTKAGGFTEDTRFSHQFDTVFNKSVRRIGGKLGLMTGLYALHLYRIQSGNNRAEARKNISHLFANTKSK